MNTESGQIECALDRGRCTKLGTEFYNSHKIKESSCGHCLHCGNMLCKHCLLFCQMTYGKSNKFMSKNCVECEDEVSDESESEEDEEMEID